MPSATVSLYWPSAPVSVVATASLGPREPAELARIDPRAGDRAAGCIADVPESVRPPRGEHELDLVVAGVISRVTAAGS